MHDIYFNFVCVLLLSCLLDVEQFPHRCQCINTEVQCVRVSLKSIPQVSTNVTSMYAAFIQTCIVSMHNELEPYFAMTDVGIIVVNLACLHPFTCFLTCKDAQ